MTSTIFSGKTFSKLYKWAFKRNRPILIIFSVLMALGILIDLYVLSLSDSALLFGNRINEELGTIGIVSIIVAQGGAVLMTLISSLLTFSFLHNKRSVDLFGELPTTRGTIYLSHLLGGLTAVGLPYVVGSLLVVGLTTRSLEVLMTELLILLFGILGITAAYVFTALIAYCCGTTMDTAIITLVLNAVYAGAVMLFWGMASEMIPGIEFESIVYTPVITLFVPYAFTFFADAYLYSDMTSAIIFLLIWNVLFIAGFSALGMYMARRRKAEIAQSDFEVKWLPIVTKAGTSVVAGGMIGFIAGSSSSSGIGNMAAFAFWYIIISFVAFFIVHVVLSRGLKGKFMPSFAAYLCTTVAVFAIAFGMTMGLGIDKYVPSPSNVKSVTFGYNEYKDPENIKTITEIHKIITDGIRNSEYPYYIGSSEYVEDYYDSYYYNNTDPYNMTVDGETGDVPASDEKNAYTYEEMRTKYPLVDYTQFDFEYRKYAGFATMRSYYLSMHQSRYFDYEAIEKLLRELYSSDEYKRMNNEVLWNDEMRHKASLIEPPTLNYMAAGKESYFTNSYDGSSYQSVYYVNLPQGEVFVEKLCAALKEDILADTEYYKSVNPNYSVYAPDTDVSYGDSYLTVNIQFKAPNGDEESYGYYVNKSYYYNDKYYLNVIVPYSYKNTIKLLNDNFIDTDVSSKKNAETIDYYDHLRYNSAANDSYINFGYSGDYDLLREMTVRMARTLEYTAMMRADYDGDYAKWDEYHGEQFTKLVTAEATELYNKYKNDKDYIVFGYSNEYMEEQDIIGGDYFYMADTILRQLDERAEELFREADGLASDEKSGSENSTDTDKAAAGSETDLRSH